MEIKKCLEKLNLLVNSFVSEFDCVAVLGNEFCYLPFLDFIVYQLDFSMRLPATRDFMKSVKRLKPHVKLTPFVWAVLHEVGHHETYYDMTEEENRRCDKKKARIEKTHARWPYYNQPDEVLATTWAVNYANENVEKVKEFERNLLEIVADIFVIKK